MTIKRGSSYTPDKKDILIQEIRDELSKLDTLLKKDGFVQSVVADLRKSKSELVTQLQTLMQKKGVVTPQETDKILDSITLSKKTRISNDSSYKFKFGYASLVLLALVGYGIYHMSKAKYE